jgi:PAS domain S-box-containing protein
MNNFFKKLSLPVKLLLLVLFPLVLIIYLTFEIYSEKNKKVELLAGYLERINVSSDISDLINALQLERRYSYAYSLNKNIDSKASYEAQRPVTDLALTTIEQRKDSTLKNFRDYTFLNNLDNIRQAIDTGTSPDRVMQYYTTAIFRINTLNMIVPVGTNRYLQPVFSDLVSQKILSEMVTYMGIMRANIYNALYSKQNMIGILYGLMGVHQLYNSYESEFMVKASPAILEEYKKMLNNSELKPTREYLDRIFAKFSFDTLYDAEQWWQMSEKATDKLLVFQKDLLRSVKTRMNTIYQNEARDKDITLIFLIVALVFVFATMAYTTHIITQVLSGLNVAAQRISVGAPGGVRIKNISNDVIGSLGESISKIDENNKILADAADVIGRGNFDISIKPRGEEDALGNAIIRMRDNLRRFTREIEKSKEEFSQVANTAPVMVWMTDENKLCSFVNKGWLKFTGRKKEQELGYGWIEGMHPEDYPYCAEVFNDAFNDREKYHLEYRFKSGDGEYKWLSEIGVPRYSAEGKFEGYIGTCIDIHEMKVHEQRKDDFIKMASHELKTPVTSIKGYIQLLLNMIKDLSEKESEVSNLPMQSLLITIDRQVIKLTRLISELLDLSKIDTGKLDFKMQDFDLTDMIKETVEDVQHTTTQQIIIKSDSNCTLYGDKDRISQVLLNLLTNAIKYSAKTSNIEVIVNQSSENAIAVSVKDEGIGIDKKDQENIFERFYRVEGKTEQTYPGFGIGLFIASEIIRRHNGTIRVESEKGKGSTFTFTLPLNKMKNNQVDHLPIQNLEKI